VKFQKKHPHNKKPFNSSKYY